MTKAEQAALAEMDTTSERIAERQEHISQLLNGSVHEQLKASVALMDSPSTLESAEKLAAVMLPKRRPRKDKGIPRQKAPAIAQQPGTLSALQVLRLRDLIDIRETRRIELETAKDHLANREGALDAADNELDDFLNEIQGKEKNG